MNGVGFLSIVQSGLKCHIEELLEAFAKALDAAVQEEFDLSSLVSDEEWEAIRPTKSERRDSLLSSIKVRRYIFGWWLKRDELFCRTNCCNMAVVIIAPRGGFKLGILGEGGTRKIVLLWLN